MERKRLRSTSWIPPGEGVYPQVEVTVEIPRWSFLKRGSSGQVDFIAPLPCPYNYGAIDTMVGLDGDLLDAVILGPRLPRGTRVSTTAYDAIGLIDRDMYDDKLICSRQPLSAAERNAVLRFFHLYARAKRLLNALRGQRGKTVCEGWTGADAALGRARPIDGRWKGPLVGF
jgi:inorganic pyrophosphatase